MITRIGFVTFFAFIISLPILSPRYRTPVAACIFPVQDQTAAGVRCSRDQRSDRCTQSSDANQPPEVKIIASKAEIVLPCPENKSSSSCSTGDIQRVQLQACALDKDFDKLLYTYATTGGRITGDGAQVTWDLTGLRPGAYLTSVEVDDGCGCVSWASVRITVKECLDCK